MPLTEDVADRFWSYVVKGPTERDCWLWTGAIADDAYGRFWLSSHPCRVVRPHRLVYELVTGQRLDEDEVMEHETCDNPICVRFAGDPANDHLLRSTQAANLARMGQRGRGGGAWLAYRWAGTDRASLAARSRRLRAAVKDGWDQQRIEAALTESTDQLALW